MENENKSAQLDGLDEAESKADNGFSPLGWVFASVVYFYRYVISPFTNASCRYQPTCSQYALDALRLHGGFRGSWMALKRIGRCHPWGGSGFDPVCDGQTPSKPLKSSAEEFKNQTGEIMSLSKGDKSPKKNK